MEQRYPKWIYASGGRAQQVASPDAELAEGPGWYSHPSLIPDGAEPAAPAAPQSPPEAPVAPPEVPDEDAVRTWWGTPVRLLEEQVAEMTAVEVAASRAYEDQRPSGGRKTVYALLDERLTALQG